MWLRRTSRLGRSVTAMRGAQRSLERVEVVGDLAELLDVPAVRREALGDVVAVGELGVAVDGDVVVVVDADQVAEAEVAGERRRLVADALHEAAVAGDDERVVVDRRRRRSGRAGCRSAMAMPTALAKPWPSGPVVTSTPAVWRGLGVPGRARLPLAERLDVVELEAVAGEVQHRVLQDRGVAVGQHEAVAVGPRRIGRIVAS